MLKFVSNTNRYHHDTIDSKSVLLFVSRMQEVSDVLKSWVSDATPDYSAIRSARVPDDGARGGSGSQDRPKPFINRVELLAMFAKQK